MDKGRDEANDETVEIEDEWEQYWSKFRSSEPQEDGPSETINNDGTNDLHSMIDAAVKVAVKKETASLSIVIQNQQIILHQQRMLMKMVKEMQQDMKKVVIKKKVAPNPKIWPVKTEERLKELEDEIGDENKREELAISLSSLNHKILEVADQSILLKYSISGRGTNIKLESNKVFDLAIDVWAEGGDRTDVLLRIDNELTALRNRCNTKKYEQKKKQGAKKSVYVKEEDPLEDVQDESPYFLDIKWPIQTEDQLKQLEIDIQDQEKREGLALSLNLLDHKITNVADAAILDKFSVSGKYRHLRLQSNKFFDFVINVWANNGDKSRVLFAIDKDLDSLPNREDVYESRRNTSVRKRRIVS